MSTWEVVAVAAGVVVLYELWFIQSAIRSLTNEVQTTRKVLMSFLATDEAHEGWKSWPHMTARLLEEMRGDMQVVRRILGREHDNRLVEELESDVRRVLGRDRPDPQP